MKNLLTTLLAFTITLGAIAEVPSLINYQGKLSDESGNPVNGTKTFSLKIYDAKTGGKEIYQESIGNVALKNGIYSFGFGEDGKSVSTANETIGFTDGEKQVFNYTVKNTPILGETKISASDYTWTESGPSDATKFTATASKNNGTVSAIFIAGVPDFGEQILISYDHHSDGVMGALSRGGQAWLELIVDNKPMSPRERLVTVPFALKAAVSDALSKDIMVPIWKDGDNAFMQGQGPGIRRLEFTLADKQKVTNNSSNNFLSKFRVPECKKLRIVFGLNHPNNIFDDDRKLIGQSNQEIPFDVTMREYLYDSDNEASVPDYLNVFKFRKTNERYTYELNSPKPGIYGLLIFAMKLNTRYTAQINSVVVYAVY
jgi:hypothetical protein